MMTNKDDGELVLLTGATGYIGGRLLGVLEEDGLRVRALARHPGNVSIGEGSKTEVVAGDLLDPTSLVKAMSGVTTAY